MIAIYKVFDDDKNIIDSGVVYNYPALFEKTFSPNSEWVVLDKVKGKTYGQKKANLHDLAVYMSYMWDAEMSWRDVSMICDWFASRGRRYGLMAEFKENGIC